jgi:aminopeptidase N
VGAEDDAWRAAIRNAKLERLRLLEIQQAQNGRATDPAITMEIAATKRELGMAESLVQAKVSQEFAQEIGRDGQFLVLTQLIGEVSKRIELVAAAGEERGEAQARRIELVATTIGERIDRVEERQAETTDRQDRERFLGQKRTKLAVFAIAVALVILSGGVIFIIATLKAYGL